MTRFDSGTSPIARRTIGGPGEVPSLILFLTNPFMTT